MSTEEETLLAEPELGDVESQETWGALIWSFAASGAMTVSINTRRLSCAQLTGVQLAAYFFPVVFAVPLFGNYLASDWLWTFTPSLSYIGQGESSSRRCCIRSSRLASGIIMGFPTTLSMNLVCIVLCHYTCRSC